MQQPIQTFFDNPRLKICRDCENFIKVTSTCKLCGCFMLLKTKFPNSTCPINKW